MLVGQWLIYRGCVRSAKILPFSSDIANELNEMVLSQGMLDLRSFGYGHRYIAGVKKKNQLELCLKKFWPGLLLLRARGWSWTEGRCWDCDRTGNGGFKILASCKPDNSRLQVVSMEPMVTVPQGRPGAGELVAQLKLNYHLYFNN